MSQPQGKTAGMPDGQHALASATMVISGGSRGIKRFDLMQEINLNTGTATSMPMCSPRQVGDLSADGGGPNPTLDLFLD